jgi:glycosyltransferase involved in cell wall biosynthesis
MTAREAVFCRETFWQDTIRVSTNVVAEEFVAHGWRCAWLTGPVALTRRFWQSGAQRRRLDLWRCGGERHGSVLQYAPGTPVTWSWRPGLRSAWLGRNALRFACPSLPRVLARHDYSPRPQLLWIGSLSMASAVAAIPAERVGYHAHDLFMDYSGAPSSVRAIERWLIDRADGVFATSMGTRDALVERYGVDPGKVHFLGHGAHLEGYVAQPEPVDLRHLPHPRAVAVGTLAEVDAQLLWRLARRRPDVQFVCIGPGGEHLRRDAAGHRLDNVHVLGPRPHEAMPPYLMFADVGLVLYPFADVNGRRAGCLPMKALEYAAAGLPVVSTWLPEYERVGAPIRSARNEAELHAAFDAALEADATERTRMRAFADAHGWNAKYDFICERLGL